MAEPTTDSNPMGGTAQPDIVVPAHQPVPGGMYDHGIQVLS